MNLGLGGRETLAVSYEMVSEVHVFTVSGELDLATSPKFSEAFSAQQVTGARVIFDLTGVTFLDSSGLSVLLQCHQRLETADSASSLSLVIGSSVVQRVIEVTGLDQVFEIYPEIAQAVRGRTE